MAEQQNPFESRLIRSMIGLSGGIIIAVGAVLYVEGIIRWVMIGIAALDVLVTPYILKRVVQQHEGASSGF